VAAETADIILVNSNPVDVTSLILFGKATYKKMLKICTGVVKTRQRVISDLFLQVF